MLDVSIQLIESIGKLVLGQLVGFIANSRHVLHHETNESFHVVFNYTVRIGEVWNVAVNGDGYGIVSLSPRQLLELDCWMGTSMSSKS